MSNSQGKFWSYFILFNLLLFLPKYLMDTNALFFPDFSIAETFSDKWELFFRRSNNDVFRLSSDFLLLVFAIYLLRKKLTSNLWGVLFFVFYLGLLLYQFYDGALVLLYHIDPLFYSDYFLISDGFPIIMEALGLFKLTFTIIGLLVFVFLLFLLFKHFVAVMRKVVFGKISKTVVIIILLICTLSTINFATRLTDQRLSFPLISYLIFDNVKRSLIVQNDIQNFDFEEFRRVYDYSTHTLKKKPNVFLLFIESYGKIVYDNEQLSGDYLEQMALKEARLSKKGWHTASAFSISPVTGGRSWLAYTSFMLGTKIDEQATYRYLVDNKGIKFSGFFQNLQAADYTTYRLSVLPDHRDNIPYDDYSRMYGFDAWIHRKDINYHGKVYGWGPAPDDQYSLNFANEYMRSKPAPFALFFINLNTHNPFDSPTELVRDWRELGKTNDGRNVTAESKFFQKPTIENYAKAIKYQFDYLTDFIIKAGDDDLFILIGDHQPPLLAGKLDGFETLVHIISKDSSFVASFVAEGFTSGMKVREGNNIFKHEGLYSLMMREFVRHYGKDSLNLPVYLPNGFLKE